MEHMNEHEVDDLDFELAMMTWRVKTMDMASAKPSDPQNPLAWAGLLRDGWTELDMTRALETLSNTLEVDLVAVWDYDDMYGYGGSSEIGMRQNGKFQPTPEVAEYLAFGDKNPYGYFLQMAYALASHDTENQDLEPVVQMFEREPRNLAREQLLGEKA
jgi:hypothetical protein